MNYRTIIAGTAFLALVGCRTPITISRADTQKNIAVDTSIPEDAAAAATIAPYKTAMERQMNAKISYTPVELSKTGDNSTLGNLLADYTYQGAQEWAENNQVPGVDAAVINIGGIRSTINKGDILLKHVYEVMPFENEVVVVKMSGKDLQGLFDYYLLTMKNNPVSHLQIEVKDGRLTQKLVNGKPIDDSKTYYIATSDYLAFGGDNMKFFSKGELINTGIKLRDLFISKFKNDAAVTVPSDLRLNFNRKNAAQ